MKLRLKHLLSNCLVIAFSALLLFGCGGGGGGLINDDGDTDPLTPEPVEEEDVSGPRPSENAPVITTTDREILDVVGQPILMRGVNLQFGDNPDVRIAGIEPIAELGSNVVRLQLRENTTADQLEAALEEIVEHNMIALVMLWEEEGKITCTEDDAYLFQALEDLWLGEWLPVLAQDRFQPYLMINIANEWGPMNIFNANSVGYSDFIANYKILIRQFRDAGFKVPLVIDAPHCGQDFNAFLGGRGRELRAADEHANIVLSVHAYESRWNTSDKIIAATDQLAGEKVPFIVGEFGGSGVNGDNSINHLDLMSKSRGDKSLVFQLPWEAADDAAAFVYTMDETVDLSGATITFDVYMPDKYVEDGNLGLQLYVRDEGGRYANFGLKQANSLRGNAWNRIEYAVDAGVGTAGFADADFDLTTAQQIGFEILANGKPVQVQADIKFDNLKIEAFGEPDPDQPGADRLLATFDSDTENWARAWGASGTDAVTQAEGALVVAPDWPAVTDPLPRIAVAPADIAQLDPPLDISGPITVSANVYLPAGYSSESALYFKFYFMDKNWTWFEAGNTLLDQFTLDGWTTISVDIAGFPDGFDTTQRPNAFGFEIGGIYSGHTEGVMVDDIRITGEPSAPRETVFELLFAEAGEVAAFAFDFSAGSFDEYALENAKIHDFGVQPFGWIAWSWKGNGAGTAALDMSTSEGSVALTQRGEEIANSSIGIAATAQPVNFE